MKLLTVTVPCYNSEGYMRHCVDTLLPGGDEVEIIIVNDGSTKDNTLGVARELERAHPGIIRVVDKPNGGHGSAVMAGIRAASGKYFKVVDSDDWVDTDALAKVLGLLRGFEQRQEGIDLLLSNFVYDKQGASRKKAMRYHHVLPRGRTFTWDECGHFPLGKYILMHSIIYRTEVLRTCGLELPEHTFYVDNIFAFKPFPYCRTLYYLDVDLYHYFIGRDDQSVNEHVMIRRLDQQLRVNYIMADEFKKDAPLLDGNRRLRRYMFKYLEIITGVSSIMCYLSRDRANYAKKKALWQHVKDEDRRTYRALRRRLFGISFALPGAFGRRVCTGLYHLGQRWYGFN